MKIFCIGRNYIDHAKELNNPMPEEPMVFMKPSTALLTDNKDFYHPAFSKDIHYEVEIVLKIKKPGKHIQPQFSHLYYDQVALGIDFTARDVQDKAKAKGHPWEKAKAFDHSAVISSFLPMQEVISDKGISFSLQKNGQVVQSGNTVDMAFDFDTIISHISEYFSVQPGDLIYTGTPAGVGKIEMGDLLEGYIGDQLMFSCKIK